MMAWPEGRGTVRTVTGPRAGSAAAGGASHPGAAPTARPRCGADLPRDTGLRCSPPPAPPRRLAFAARYSATPWCSLVAGLASISLPGPAPQPRRTDHDAGPVRASPIVSYSPAAGASRKAFLLLLRDQDAGHCPVVDLEAQTLAGDRYRAATPRNY
jgi:hypothetical protein